MNKKTLPRLIPFYYSAPLVQNNLLLDLYTGSQVGLSLRKISGAYSGACIKVRRSTDSALLDIGFVNDELDTVSLIAFVGTGSGKTGFIHTWFDQSGNGRDFVQTTIARQPIIVINGSVLTTNSKPSILFTGATNNFLSLTTSAFAGMVFDLYSVNLIGVYTGGNNYESPILGINNDLQWGVTKINPSFQETSKGMMQRDAITSTMSIPYPELGIQKLVNFYNAAGNINTITFNNHSGWSSVQSPVALIGSQNLLIGSFNVAGGEFSGSMQELIFWNGNQVANKSGIKSNITSHFSIAPAIYNPLPLSEDFSLYAFTLPAGWYCFDFNAFLIDQPDNIGPPYFNCDLVGSSGGEALVFTNPQAQTDWIVTKPISTLGKTSIKVNWNEFRTVGAPTLTLDWSVDGVNFTPIGFTDVPDDDFWHSISEISLPSGAENQYILMLRFSANCDGFGLGIWIDDLIISGT